MDNNYQSDSSSDHYDYREDEEAIIEYDDVDESKRNQNNSLDGSVDDSVNSVDDSVDGSANSVEDVVSTEEEESDEEEESEEESEEEPFEENNAAVVADRSSHSINPSSDSVNPASDQHDPANVINGLFIERGSISEKEMITIREYAWLHDFDREICNKFNYHISKESLILKEISAVCDFINYLRSQQNKAVLTNAEKDTITTVFQLYLEEINSIRVRRNREVNAIITEYRDSLQAANRSNADVASDDENEDEEDSNERNNASILVEPIANRQDNQQNPLPRLERQNARMDLSSNRPADRQATYPEESKVALIYNINREEDHLFFRW